MITKADFRIQELKDYIMKSENKNSDFRNTTDAKIDDVIKDIDSMKQDLA